MVVGIGGVSRSGKTSLANRIKSLLSGKTEILSLDDFVKPREQLSRIQNHIDWEIPETYDFGELLDAIKSSIHLYDHTIVEGILILHNESINVLFDKVFFLEIDKEIFMQRKIIDDRWGIEPDWYIEHIWASYLKYNKVSKNDDCIMMSGSEQISDNLLSSYIF